MRQNIDINNKDYIFKCISENDLVSLNLYPSVGKMPYGYIEYPNDKVKDFYLEQKDSVCNIDIVPKKNTDDININLYLPSDYLNNISLYNEMEDSINHNKIAIKDFKVEKMNLHGEHILLKNSTINNLLVSESVGGILNIEDCHIKNLHISNPYGSIFIKNSNIENICLDTEFSIIIFDSNILEISSNSTVAQSLLFIENSKIDKTNLSKAAFQANSSLIGNININEGWLSLVNCNFNQNNDISINKGDIYLTLKDDQILKRKIFNKKIGSTEENKKVLTKLKTELGYIIKKN